MAETYGLRLRARPPDLEADVSQPKRSKLSESPQHVVADNVKTSTVKSSRVCSGTCGKVFPSSEHLDFHSKMKREALSKCKMRPDQFKSESHLLVCKFDGCCYYTAKVEEMGIHLISGSHGSKRKMFIEGEVRKENNKLIPSFVYVIPRGPSEGDSGGKVTCPSCQKPLSSQSALTRHLNDRCQGQASWSCTFCARQFRDRVMMTSHMQKAHPCTDGLHLTGVFQGTRKLGNVMKGGISQPRKGIIRGGIDTSGLQTYTFVPPSSSALSASEVFPPKQQKNLEYLVQRSKGYKGAFVVNINTSTLLLTTNSRRLEVFNTQSKLKVFSSSEEMDVVTAHIYTSVDRAARQAADASSGLTLKTIKSVSITFGASSGRRGAGGRFLSSRNWANRLKIKGATSLQVTAEDVIEDESFGIRCFQFTILHQLYFHEVAATIRKKWVEHCHHHNHQKAGPFCLQCSYKCKLELDTKGKMASTYNVYKERLDWTDVCFPSGPSDYKVFSKRNPLVKLYVYRQQVQEGDIYQEYRGGADEAGGIDVRNVHIIFASRVNEEKCELESHFLSVSNLGQLCGKIMNYYGDIKTKKYSDKAICEECLHMFALNRKEPIARQLKKVHHDFINGTVGDKVSQAYLDHINSCSFGTLGTTRMPDKGAKLAFTKIKSLQDKVLTIYIDFETSHESLSQVCFKCITLYKEARGSRKVEILERCKRDNHMIVPGGGRCEGCRQIILETIEEAQIKECCPSSHQKPTYRDEFGDIQSYPLCSSCLLNLTSNSELSQPCTHSKTIPEAALQIISYSVILIENFGALEDKDGSPIQYPRLLKEICYVGQDGESGDDILLKFWTELRDLRPLICRKWRGKFKKLSGCKLTEKEKEEFAAAAFCYGCQLPFDNVGKEDEFDDDEESVTWGKSSKRIKNCDHCHYSNQYRGIIKFPII